MARTLPLLASLAAILAGCTVTRSSTGNSQVGARLFVTDRCVSCHQVHGMGGTDGADLSQNITAVNYKLLKYFIVDHAPDAMDYVTRLHITPQQVRDLGAFAASTDSSLMPQGSSAAVTGNPQLGAQLFVADRCIRCHQVNGVGGTDSPDLTNDPAATNYDLMNSELEVPPKAMAYVAKLHLTPRQIAALAAFTASSLKPVTKK